MSAIVGAIVIGLTLGLLGSGGSILTLPVLVYLLGHESKVAVAESLAIVGVIALFAVLPYARSLLVDWRNVVYFGLPGMLGTYLGAWLSRFVSGAAQLTLFALVMLLAAGLMFRPPRSRLPHSSDAAGPSSRNHRSLWKISLEGLIIGVLTGLVGVGGGFLIVPALVLLGDLPMRTAVGTSLAVIAMKSLAGFVKYLDVLHSLDASIDWPIVAAFASVGVVGSFAGSLLANHIHQAALRRLFAVFLVLMGLFVLGKEAPALLAQLHQP